MGAFFGENRLNRVNSSFSLNDTSAMLPFLIGRVFGNLRVHSSLATGDYPCRFAVCLQCYLRETFLDRIHIIRDDALRFRIIHRTIDL